MLTCEHKYVYNKLNYSNIIFRPNFSWMILFCQSNFFLLVKTGYGKFFFFLTFSLVLKEYWSLSSLDQVPFCTVLFWVKCI